MLLPVSVCNQWKFLGKLKQFEGNRRRNNISTTFGVKVSPGSPALCMLTLKWGFIPFQLVPFHSVSVCAFARNSCTWDGSAPDQSPALVLRCLREFWRSTGSAALPPRATAHRLLRRLPRQGLATVHGQRLQQIFETPFYILCEHKVHLILYNT